MVNRYSNFSRTIRQVAIGCASFALAGCVAGPGTETSSSEATAVSSVASSVALSSSMASSSQPMMPVETSSCDQPVNIAAGLAGVGSSIDTNTDDTSPNFAFDQNPATRWSSAYTDNEWLSVDLGSEAVICSFAINWEDAYGTVYNLETSMDGSNWQTVYAEVNGNGGQDTITLAAPAPARYVRFKGVERGTQWGYSFWELEVLGAYDGPPVAQITAPNSAIIGESLSFSGAASVDPGGNIVSYAWNFGDGNSAQGPEASHSFSAAGSYNVTLSVTDNDNNLSQQTLTVNVRENVMAGKGQYDEQCALCHGDNGEGTDFGTPLSAAKWQDNVAGLAQAIDLTMPKGNIQKCQGSCATNVAAYIMTFAPASAMDCDNKEAPLPRTLRLLTNREYQNSINDLFSVPALTNITASFPGGVRVHGFDNNAFAESVSESRIGVYWDAANTVANSVIESRFNAVVGCDQLNANCAGTFVADMGRKIFRRPLSNEEQGAYVDIFLSGGNAREGAAKVLKGFLISPNFLYRPEQGVADGDHFRLTPWETATLLAYTFTGSTPDNALLSAAQNNQLQTRAQLTAQVQRLLSSPKANAAIIDFARQWLMLFDFKDVSKDTRVYSDFTPAVKAGMEEEFQQFMQSVLLGEATQFSDLYVSNHTYANAALANYYGLNGATATTSRIDTNGERGGILKLGALLARQGKANDTSPVLRGVFVRKHLLCQPMPLPDATLEINIPMPVPGVSPRERFSQHSADPSCASCHQYIDDVGFGFDTFDGAGKAVANPDDVGVLTGLNELTAPDAHPFKGVHELSVILSDANSAAACVIENFQIYATGQEHQDACTVQTTAERWRNGGYSFQQLWQEIVSANTFLIRE
ncbi:DUF1592 domain-containing protein [Marinagarivorans cellulosilyticus]|uniref:PKD domain-containing protein n=1 Tax=Marinagarivorans cellulosilyticus TaxID=2721545 RepID=A0AAN1WJG7_9GAMM|nr:DUF1592 domain-containing protein [Marinagarivorans cellulosilyticus]BCD98740.1 hypothetical protein MARGE09_P2941 [Marinagarivorans cellulosilyticus]